ncbi:MAG: hypothetical protein ACPGYT_12730, partial [Nitrospirales bacterium]
SQKVAPPASAPDMSAHSDAISQPSVAPQTVSHVQVSPEGHAVSKPKVVSPNESIPQSSAIPRTDSQVEPSPETEAARASYSSSDDEPMSQTQIIDKPSGDKPVEVVQNAMMSAQTGSYAFRHANWGMSIPEVKTTETADFSWELDSALLLAGEHRLGYQTQVKGIDTFLSYAFENDRLRSAKYLFETGYLENDAQPLSHYKAVKAWIIEAYGPPQSEGKLWVNELYRYAPELWGRALMRGHLTIVDEWDVDGTTITLLLNGGEETVGLMAEFMTKNLSLPNELVHVPVDLLSIQSFVKS